MEVGCMLNSTVRVFLKAIVAVSFILGMVSASWSAELKIGTGAAAAENIFKKIRFPLEKDLGIKLDIIDSGPVQALKDLDAGTINCAVGGIAFTDWMEMMEKGGYPIPDKSVYKNWVIGEDKIKVLTNTDAPVATLSKEQLVSIFTGKSNNWSQVGGPDKPIVVILGSQIPGTQSVFRKQIMENAEFTKNAMIGTTAEDVKSRVIRNSGGISLGTLSQVDFRINSPAIPDISRPVTLITRGAPSETVKKMLDFINGDGQRYITK
jgi:phosphate transport system substrate-binding protein